MPRKTSVYPAEKILSGVKTGPGRLRSTARNSANSSTKTSAMQKIAMLRTNFDRIFGKAYRNSAGSKNEALNSGQPGDRTIRIATTPKKISELATAIQTFRALRSPPPNSFDPRSPVGGGTLGSPGPPFGK